LALPAEAVPVVPVEEEFGAVRGAVALFYSAAYSGSIQLCSLSCKSMDREGKDKRRNA
jgi:hypothetical protein